MCGAVENDRWFEVSQVLLKARKFSQIKPVLPRWGYDSVLRMRAESTAEMLSQKAMSAKHNNVHGESPLC